MAAGFPVALGLFQHRSGHKGQAEDVMLAVPYSRATQLADGTAISRSLGRGQGGGGEEPQDVPNTQLVQSPSGQRPHTERRQDSPSLPTVQLPREVAMRALYGLPENAWS